MTHTLIVNRTGDLSAVATPDDLDAGVFLTAPSHFNLYPCDLDEPTLTWLYEHRDRCQVVGPGLPLLNTTQIADPTYAYVQITAVVENETTTGSFAVTPITVSSGVVFRFVREQVQARLDAAFAEAKLGRFHSSVTGVRRWYDGKDFLLFALAFQARNVTAPFACAASDSAPWGVAEHTPAQLLEVGGEYAAWYQSLQVHYYNRQEAINTAQTIEQLEAVIW
jgi:hypothetical protein